MPTPIRQAGLGFIPFFAGAYCISRATIHFVFREFSQIPPYRLGSFLSVSFLTALSGDVIWSGHLGPVEGAAMGRGLVTHRLTESAENPGEI